MQMIPGMDAKKGSSGLETCRRKGVAYKLDYGLSTYICTHLVCSGSL